MDLGESFSPNYFSPADIIAFQIRIPCTTEVVLPNFGFLEPSLNSDDLPAQSQIELPLWAARSMTSKTRKHVTTKIPKMYKEAYREALKADPSVVDLNKMGPNFYQSGMHLLSTLDYDEAEEVGNVLPQVLQNRLLSIADSYSYTKTLTAADDDSLANCGSLMKEVHMDVVERQIFQDSKNSFESLLSWLEK